VSEYEEKRQRHSKWKQACFLPHLFNNPYIAQSGNMLPLDMIYTFL
jgi:hypothetical protein